MEANIREIAENFQIFGEFITAQPYGIGHIHDTYAATYNQGGTLLRYLHQRINHHVFNDPISLMSNIERITAHIHGKLNAQGANEISRRVLTVVPARDNRSYYSDKTDNFWRTYVFIENGYTCETVETPEQAGEIARTFGKFQMLLADFPAQEIHETIPAFHDTRKRFISFENAVTNDSHNRAQKARKEIDFALRRSHITSVLLDLLAKETIPWRIAHNDTKANNVILDNTTKKGMCVVDLDTIMPGTVLYDFGDMVRSIAGSAKEDERNFAGVTVRMPMFEALVRGYLAGAKFLTEEEIRMLIFSGLLITFETGIRFLTDYLEGDMYFKTHRPGQNLDRCRTQFGLVEAIERQQEDMERAVENVVTELKNTNICVASRRIL